MTAYISEGQLGPWWPKWRKKLALAIAILAVVSVLNLFICVMVLVRG